MESFGVEPFKVPNVVVTYLRPLLLGWINLKHTAISHDFKKGCRKKCTHER